MQKKLDLLLINPGNAKQVYQSLGSNLSAIEPPVWVGLIATFMLARGFSVQIIDAHAEGYGPEDVSALIKKINPVLSAVVVYGHQPSASTQSMPAAGALCSAIKQADPNQKIILLGGHVAALPERTLKEEAADFVCDSEGPYTVLDLVQALKAGGSKQDFEKVRGLVFWDGKNVSHGKPAALVSNLEQELPRLSWELLPMKKYRAHNWHCFGDLERQPYASLYTTLGCPYHCTFCCIQAPFKSGEKASGLKEEVNSYRFWSPLSIVNQIGELVEKYGVRNIKFADEMFVLNAKHVIGICDLLIERKYNVNIWSYARIDTVKDGMVEKLKKAGINWLAFGIESGSDVVRDQVDKRFEQDQIYDTIRKVKAGGISVIGNYIFGLPYDDEKSMQSTLDLALDLNCEFANFYCAMAYPGSPLYQTALKENLPLPKSWSGYSQHSVDSLPLPTKYLNSGQVIQFRDKAFQIYFNHPKYLGMIREKYGDKTVQHIKEMASYTLERQNVKPTQKVSK